MECLICKHAAESMMGDIKHIVNGFHFSIGNHEITYPAPFDSWGVPRLLTKEDCTFYICIGCTEQLQKLICKVSTYNTTNFDK
jgi:hypothetical protein